MKRNTLISILITLGFICAILVVILVFKQRSGAETEKDNAQLQQPIATQLEEIFENSAVENNETEENQVIDVDESLFNVTITLPATFFEDTTEEDIKSAANEKGIKEVTINENGSVTYVMSKQMHNQLMDEMKAGVLEFFEELKGEEYSSILDVEYNNDLSKITLVVDKQAYESSFDAFAVFGIGLQCMYYQSFEGKEMYVEINSKDNSTGEVFSTTIYPDSME